MKIYTITCSNAYNYGAVLQAYALQCYLENQGNSVEIIDYYPPYLRKISEKYRKNIFLRVVRSILYFPDYHKSEMVFKKFKQEYLNNTRKCTCKEDIISLEKPDLYIAGSDQIWNPHFENGRDENYFLNFGKVNKVSYAASIALPTLEKKFHEDFRNYLKDYLTVTVREKKNVETLQNIGIQSDYVVDPVYLLSLNEWRKLCTEKCEDDYILVYALHHVQKIYDYAFDLAKKINAKVYVVNVEIKEKRRGNDKFFWNPTVNTFLSLIANSKAVVSNSFHGISFGLIFNKPIHLFDTEDNDLRLKNIIDIFELRERCLNVDYTDILDNSINEKSLKLIENETRRSKRILQSALEKVEINDE